MIDRILSSADDYSVWIVAVVGGFGALGWLGRKMWRGVRATRAFITKASRGLDQLQNNGGSSIKDSVERIRSDVDGMTSVVDLISEAVDTLTERFETHLTTQAEANRAMWPAVEAVAKSIPPSSEAS